jgi:hypothetical protein
MVWIGRFTIRPGFVMGRLSKLREDRPMKHFFLTSALFVISWAALGAVSSGQVISVTLGVHTNCPYGLNE